jgi:hypothetical protein
MDVRGLRRRRQQFLKTSFERGPLCSEVGEPVSERGDLRVGLPLRHKLHQPIDPQSM